MPRPFRIFGCVRGTQWIGAILGLFAAFFVLMVWFGEVDFYHRHFFTTGPIVAADNIARIGFVLLLSWLVYAPGAAISALMVRRYEADLTPLERAVMGFGFGIGLWHVAMLILGVLGLYYRSILIAGATLVLLGSAPHFAAIVTHARRSFAERMAALRRGEERQLALSIVLIALSAAWLLVVRGLYPGGGGDYYNHYFPYFIEVLNNHSLAPNDVWYHYYYSKGSGLVFLGMLLTDPEAPALATSCCVMFAAAAIYALIARIAPRSLWPACGVLLYLLFNLVELSDIQGSGGEFQKDHEITTALLVVVIWGVCMARAMRLPACLAMATSSAVAAAIIAQPMGVILTLYFALLSASAILRRMWGEFGRYGVAATVVGVCLFAILVLNFVVTGLATDQELDLALRFADITRLDRWGVLPQVVMTVWIRSNYADLATPFGWQMIGLLRDFMRLDVLWVFLIGPAIALAFLAGSRLWADRTGRHAATTDLSYSRIAIACVGVLLGLLILIALATGRVQSISFERFSSFFMPLLTLFGIAVIGWVMAQRGSRGRWWLGLAMPPFLLAATVLSWHLQADWGSRVSRATDDGVQFLLGNYSLADGYTNQELGPPYGGINPRALAAWRHVEPGAAIWATNVSSHCMVPGCWIESVVSFKMSGQLDEILAGSPERAKELLQRAGLSYFLIFADEPLFDILPYSRLFSPDTIGQYLGIKWTDGSTYLLTWVNSDTRPLDKRFLEAYAGQLTKSDNESFEFAALSQQMSGFVTRVRSSPWGTPIRIALTPQDDSEGGVAIVDATYGGNCRGYRPRPPARNVFREGNATRSLKKACSGKQECSFTVGIPPLSDPVNGCDKDFAVAYRCPPDKQVRTITIPTRSDGKTVEISCTAPR